MASQRIVKLFRDCLRNQTSCRVGYHAADALRHARILTQWDALESIGAVRLRSEPDPDGLALEVFDSDPWYSETREGQAVAKRCREDGAWGSIGEYRTDWHDMATWHINEPDMKSDWEQADSCWGHLGYRDVLDWRENPYVIDHMAETIRQFKAAWKAYVAEHRERRAGVCPTCHGSGRV